MHSPPTHSSTDVVVRTQQTRDGAPNRRIVVDERDASRSSALSIIWPNIGPRYRYWFTVIRRISSVTEVTAIGLCD